ncbi:hypothetical protein SEUCBS139899_008257 [Sporothrix eucalyptigena]|uniref:Phenylacetaldoxime dehydratase n=1 Tax=Sporothrix eucalyptigena TaxID=1812306 RepID=A0ABP0CE09_9PEZI
MLETAIPEHLRTERTMPTSTPPNFDPPFPAYIARYPESAKDLVMAVVGIQHAAEVADMAPSVETVNSFFASAAVPISARPRYQEQASSVDERGFYNLVCIAYWPSRGDFDAWSTTSGFEAWWQGLDPETQPHGWFLEVFFPTMDRLETVFSNNEVPAGAAHMRVGVSGPIQEHVYWGSMRDRLAVAQTDELKGQTWHRASETCDPSHRRVCVPGRPNLAIIRSGQDWSDTRPEERKLYVETMHPTLVKGMDFLRDHGDEVGCYSCRFMSVQGDKNGSDHTFGLAYFDELASLEGWSKRHPTHLAIFGGFLAYAKTLNNNIGLRLFHEVLVLEPQQQRFEYVNCHVGTGMLKSL